MQGPLAQTIGLVLSANASKRGLRTASWPDGSVYTFCKEIKFLGRKTQGSFGLGKTIELNDPNRWLKTLPSQLQRAQLNVIRREDPHISDRMSAAFANGGPVFLAQVLGHRIESWQGEWEVTDQNDQERRIWSVTYRNIPNVPIEVPNLSIESVRGELEAALAEASQFDERHSMGFGNTFAKARNALSANDPLGDYYHADLIPDELLPLEYRQTFACAAKAWVFGGMGWWNDVWFEEPDKSIYEAVSEELFSSIVSGLMLATNASAEDF